MNWRGFPCPGKTRFKSAPQCLGIEDRFTRGKTRPLQAFNGVALCRRGQRHGKFTQVAHRWPRFPRPSKQGVSDARRVARGEGGEETLATTRAGLRGCPRRAWGTATK